MALYGRSTAPVSTYDEIAEWYDASLGDSPLSEDPFFTSNAPGLFLSAGGVALQEGN
jgi:hypothetical protein